MTRKGCIRHDHTDLQTVNMTLISCKQCDAPDMINSTTERTRSMACFTIAMRTLFLHDH